MLRKLFRFLICFAFPWLVLFCYDNPGGALVALLMQATVIGWIPASMWAMRVIKETQTEKNKR